MKGNAIHATEENYQHYRLPPTVIEYSLYHDCILSYFLICELTVYSLFWYLFEHLLVSLSVWRYKKRFRNFAKFLALYTEPNILIQCDFANDLEISFIDYKWALIFFIFSFDFSICSNPCSLFISNNLISYIHNIPRRSLINQIHFKSTSDEPGN